MKKKIALLLSLIVLSQGMGIFAAAEENTAGNTAESAAQIEEPTVNESEETAKAAIRESIKEETALLTSAGVIDLSEDYDPTEPVTRAEFAEFTAAAVKGEKQMEVSYFTDVPLSYWAVDSINSLVDLNIISKASDGQFNPDRAITYVEACKMMAVMTGYDRYINPNGDMNQYITIADKAGFGIVPSEKDKITVADAIKLLYNAMRVDLVMVDSVSGNKYTVKPDEDSNIFSIYHQIKFDDGRVEGVYGKSLSNAEIQTGKTRINGGDYYVAETVSIDEYFGRYIEFAYRENNENDDSTVIYAEPKYKDDKMEIMYDDVVSYDEKTKKITYDEGEGNKTKEKIKTLSSDVTVIFNGRTYGKVLKTKLDEFVNGTRKGKVELISSNGSTDIDLVVITSYEIFVKDAYSTSSKTFYADGGKRTLKLEDYSNYTIRDANNIAVNESQMTTGPYMIAESDDKEILSVIICSEKVEGTITSVGEDEIRIGDEVYEFDKQFYNDNYGKLQTGTAYTFYLDIYNKIIDMSVYSKDGMKNAFLTRASFTDDAPEDDIMFKLYTADDETYEWYRIAEKIKIDGVSYKSSQIKDIISAFPGNPSIIDGTIKVDRQVVRYSTNEDGVINVIDTKNVLPNEDEDTTLRSITGGVKTEYYHGGRKVLGLRGYIDTSNVKYIVVPNTNDNGEIVVNGETVADTKNKYSNKFTFEDWQSYTYELFKNQSTGANRFYEVEGQNGGTDYALQIKQGDVWSHVLSRPIPANTAFEVSFDVQSAGAWTMRLMRQDQIYTTFESSQSSNVPFEAVDGTSTGQSGLSGDKGATTEGGCAVFGVRTEDSVMSLTGGAGERTWLAGKSAEGNLSSQTVPAITTTDWNHVSLKVVPKTIEWNGNYYYKFQFTACLNNDSSKTFTWTSADACVIHNTDEIYALGFTNGGDNTTIDNLTVKLLDVDPINVYVTDVNAVSTANGEKTALSNGLAAGGQTIEVNFSAPVASADAIKVYKYDGTATTAVEATKSLSADGKTATLTLSGVTAGDKLTLEVPNTIAPANNDGLSRVEATAVAFDVTAAADPEIKIEEFRLYKYYQGGKYSSSATSDVCWAPATAKDVANATSEDWFKFTAKGYNTGKSETLQFIRAFKDSDARLENAVISDITLATVGTFAQDTDKFKITDTDGILGAYLWELSTLMPACNEFNATLPTTSAE